VRVGGLRPGRMEAIDTTTIAKNAVYVKNSSDERRWVYTC
jgi:hypothetical protein